MGPSSVPTFFQNSTPQWSLLFDMTTCHIKVTLKIRKEGKKEKMCVYVFRSEVSWDLENFHAPLWCNGWFYGHLRSAGGLSVWSLESLDGSDPWPLLLKDVKGDSSPIHTWYDHPPFVIQSQVDSSKYKCEWANVVLATFVSVTWTWTCDGLQWQSTYTTDVFCETTGKSDNNNGLHASVVRALPAKKQIIVNPVLTVCNIPGLP